MARHLKIGLEQVTGQVLHICPTVPSTEQTTRQEISTVETIPTHGTVL